MFLIDSPHSLEAILILYCKLNPNNMYVATLNGKNYQFKSMPDFIRNPFESLKKKFELDNNSIASKARRQAFQDMIGQ